MAKQTKANDVNGNGKKSVGKKPLALTKNKNKNKANQRKSSAKLPSSPAVAASAPGACAHDDEIDWSSMADQELWSVAKAFEQMGSFDAAINAYNHALHNHKKQHHKDDPELLLALSHAHFQQQQSTQAADYLERAAHYANQCADGQPDASLLFRIAICYEQQQQWDSAIANHQQALQSLQRKICLNAQAPDGNVIKEWSLTLASLANCFGAKEDLAGALSVYQRAVELQPRNGNLHFNLATLLMAQQSLEGMQDAVSHYEQAVELLAATEKEGNMEDDQQQDKTKELYDDLLAALEALAKRKPKQFTKRLTKWRQRYQQSFDTRSTSSAT